MRGRRTMRTAALRALDPLLAGELVEGATNCDQAAAVVASQVTLGRKAITGR